MVRARPARTAHDVSGRSEPTTQPRVVTGLPSVYALLEDDRDLLLLARSEALGPVTTLTVASPELSEPLCRAALARGAEFTVSVWDAALEGVDYLGVAHVLACAVRNLCEARSATAVLVLAGDRGRGAVGPAVAERLSVPHFGSVEDVSLDKNGLHFSRRFGAQLRSYRGAPSVVLGLAQRVAPVADLDATPVTAQTLKSLDLAALGITSAELTYRRNFQPTDGPCPRQNPRVTTADELAARLGRDGLWPVVDPESGG